MQPYIFEVDRSQLRLFAKAIGEVRSEYSDAEAARAVGYADIPAPPTFLFAIGMNPAAPFDLIEAVGADLSRVLHGEQKFHYGAPVTAGRRVLVHRQIVDRYEKKGGALIFWVIEMRFVDADNDTDYGRATKTLVVRGEAA